MLLNEFKNKDHRIKIFLQKNQYAGVARNNGLKHAKGKYVVFWDSDDLFYKNALQVMVDKCEKDNADLCVCAANRYNTLLDKRIYTGTYLKREWLPKKIPFSKNTNSKYIFEFSTNVPWNKMWKREFILKNNLQFQEIKQANDAYFSMMSYFFAERISVVTKPLMDYRVNNPESLTGKASNTCLCCYDAFYSTYLRLKNEKDFTNEVKESFYSHLFSAMLYQLKIQTNENSFNLLVNKLKSDMLTDFEISNLTNLNLTLDETKNNIVEILDSDSNKLMKKYMSKGQIYLKGDKWFYKIYFNIYYSCFWKSVYLIRKILRKI